MCIAYKSASLNLKARIFLWPMVLKVTGFLLRGFEGVRAEASILSSCFNIARMISIVGVTGLIAKLGS